VKVKEKELNFKAKKNLVYRNGFFMEGKIGNSGGKKETWGDGREKKNQISAVQSSMFHLLPHFLNGLDKVDQFKPSSLNFWPSSSKIKSQLARQILSI
jgi:hypothetical protein